MKKPNFILLGIIPITVGCKANITKLPPDSYSLRFDINDYVLTRSISHNDAYSIIEYALTDYFKFPFCKETAIEVYSQANRQMTKKQKAFIDETNLYLQLSALSEGEENIVNEYYLTDTIGYGKNYVTNNQLIITGEALVTINALFRLSVLPYSDLLAIDDIEKYSGGILPDGNYLLQFRNVRTKTIVRYIISPDKSILFDSRTTKDETDELFIDRTFRNSSNVFIPDWVQALV